MVPRELGGLLVALAVLDCAVATGAPSLEWAVKAEYLLKLPPFVQWPVTAFVSPSSAFNICVVGSDPFGGLIDQAGQGQHVENRTVAILRLNAASLDAHCQVMYVAGNPQFVASALQAVRGAPVLTVTENQPGDATKGIVNFVIVRNHVRFEIDQAVALQNHLEISSKLLSIAVSPARGAS